MHNITATIENRIVADAVLSKLESAGVAEDQVSLIVTEEGRNNHFRIDEKSRADEGAAAGATFGGVTGAVLGSALGAGAIMVPGLNLVVAGSLAAGLAGLGAGAATGGLLGALVGAGIPENEAKLYEGEIKQGNILLAVEPRDSAQKDRIEAILRNSEAHNIHT